MPRDGRQLAVDHRLLTLGASIRRAIRGDLGALLELEEEAFRRPWSRAQLLAELRRKRGILWLAESDDRAVAYLNAWILPPEAEILEVAVSVSHRRRGLGRALLHTALETLEARGVEGAHLEVGASNTSARALYSSLGFQPLGRRQGYYADRDDALILGLRLGAATPDASTSAPADG